MEEIIKSTITFDEYEGKMPACFRAVKPKCPHVAVIPAITVEDKTGLKALSDCLVHVANINTTFYIDDKHRMMITWAGPVEYANYDIEKNELGLRSQFVIDTATGVATYFDAVGTPFTMGGNSGPAMFDLTDILTPTAINTAVIAEGLHYIKLSNEQFADLLSSVNAGLTVKYRDLFLYATKPSQYDPSVNFNLNDYLSVRDSENAAYTVCNIKAIPQVLPTKMKEGLEENTPYLIVKIEDGLI